MIQAHWKRILCGATALGILALGMLIFAAILWKWAALVGPASELTSPFIIVGVVVLVVAFCLVVFACFCVPRGQAAPLTGETALSTSNWVLKMLVILGVIVVGSLFTWVGFNMSLRDAGPELKLPLIVIIGVVVLLVTLALVAVTFSMLNMQDKTQPLALPEGSVRAVIALMLLLVFAIAAIFLYSNVASSGKFRIATKQTEAAITDLQKHVTVVFREPEPLPAAREGVPAPAQTFTVHYREPASPAADDLAKQLVVLLGTLVTAVASFYFGSSSVASARDAVDKAIRSVAGPNATGTRPSTLNADGTSQTLAIDGSNLQNVSAVKLMAGDGKMIAAADANSVKANATNVACTLTVPKGTAAGAYDVMVSDNANNHSTVRITIIAAPVPQPAPSAFKVERPDPVELKINTPKQQLAIIGSGLDKANKVELKLADGTIVPADKDSISPAAGKVSCTISVPQTQAAAADVVVSDGTNTGNVKINLKA